MKKWADAGFWSRSALSDTNNSDSYKNGLCVMEYAGMNPSKQVTAVQDFEKAGDGWTSDYIAYGEVTGVAYPSHATQNATSIVRGCKNPERALMVLNLLMTDPELNKLVECGVEGTDYELDSDGCYKGLNEDNFAYEGFNTWNLRNNDLRIQKPNDVIYNEMATKYEAISQKTKFPGVDIYSGFTEDYESYKTERSAVSDVMRQYLAPIQAGLVDDVEASISEFLKKAEDAGLSTCRENFKTQWAAYCEEYGYK